MDNLAGVDDCDKTIKDELQRAGIKLFKKNIKSTGEVKTQYEGRLKGFKFTRAWYYWIVSGDVPLKLAEKLYKHPEGKISVRVTGHCGCPAPKKWVTWKTENGKTLADKKELENISTRMKKLCLQDKKYKWVDDVTVGTPVIPLYHIDSQAGLLLFAMMIKDNI